MVVMSDVERLLPNKYLHPYLGLSAQEHEELTSPKLWITGKKLWIKRFFWGKLAKGEGNRHWASPHIWGLSYSTPYIFLMRP